MRKNQEAFGLLNLANFTYDEVLQFQQNDKISFVFMAE
jgi:hypothetical protein